MFRFTQKKQNTEAILVVAINNIAELEKHLKIAIKNNNENLIRQLLNNNDFDKNLFNSLTMDHGLSSIFHHAIIGCSPEIITLLINKGADINFSDRNGDNPLHLAIRWCDLDKIKLLLTYNPDLQVNGAKDLNALEYATHMFGYNAPITNAIKSHMTDQFDIYRL